MKFRFLSIALIVATLVAAASMHAAQAQAPKPTQAPAPKISGADAANQIIDKFTAKERELTEKMNNFHPLIETYIQNLDKDDELTFVPKSDAYFISKLDLVNEQKQRTLMNKPGWLGSIKNQFSQLYSVQYLPDGFATMLVLDQNFTKENYDFEYVRREFLGGVRCLVFDAKPKADGKGAFQGRIWVEDKDFNIVRFNGTNGKSSTTKLYFHFDSWREYMGPGAWLPAYIYTEESNYGYMLGQRKLRFKAQTRLWGYNVGRTDKTDELTQLIVDADGVNDNVDQSEASSPVAELRAWERQAEDNVIQRLEKAALIAPEGEVNKVLETVINNLEITNNLNIAPEVRARVLMTTPLESFTIGHTIVLSKGLVDVLPDEASLAMVLAHELAHIALGHQIDTKYAFSDRMLFNDVQAFAVMQLKRDPKEESDADQKAAEFLKNSPYRDKLGNAGLFLKAINQRAAQLPKLLKPHIGNTMVKDSRVTRMADLIDAAPELQMNKLEQIAALPLDGRVRVDAWTGQIELSKAKPVTLMSAREKMPFEVTPVFLYLNRQPTSPATKVATQASATPAAPPAEAATDTKPQN
jgi:peptidase M48-like protein